MTEANKHLGGIANPIAPNPPGDGDRAPEKELLRLQLSSYLDVYKHHFDLFLKGVAGYFVVVGTLTSFTFAKEMSRNQKIVFPVVISIGSLIALFACVISRQWVKDLERAVERITSALSGEPFPFSGAKGILSIMMVISIIFCFAGFVELWTAV
jgi:hypothetical protein